MNRTLLLIICDFLLLNLLALTRWDAPDATPARQDQPPPAAHDATPAATKDQDLVELMQLSLQDEQARRDEIARRLQDEQTRRDDLARQLQDTARQLQDTAQNLQSREQNIARLETEKTSLAASLDTAQRDAQRTAVLFSREIDDARRAAGVSRERIAALQRDLENRETELSREKDNVTRLEKNQADSLRQIQDLNVAVAVAEQEKVMLRETADAFKTQVEAERQERLRVQETTTQLAQGVGTLAEKSDDLTREIRDNRPVNANTLFNEYLASNVQVRFDIMRAGLVRPVPRSVNTRTILVSDGKDNYAILHTDDTPFALVYPAADMSRVAVTLTRGSYSTTAGQLHFLSIDPRILVMPLTPAQAAGLGAKVYLTSLEPFKFPDALLISANSDPGRTKYEETPFKLDATQPGFVQMRVGFFSSKRGDIVISKSGELLGIMVNKDYCALVNNFLPARTITAGDDTGAQGIGATISALHFRVQNMPLRLR